MNTFSYEKLLEGDSQTQSYTISPPLYEGFLALFRDVNPIHVDGDYATGAGFKGRVMHGAILQGFLSHFVGMCFPGRNSLLLSADISYLKPNYLNDVIEIQATIGQKLDTHRVVVLNVQIHNTTQNVLAARGRVQVKVL